MIFGAGPVRDALGATLVHAVSAGGKRFKKGRVLSTADVAALIDAGVEDIVTVRFGPDDVVEDAAAAEIAAAVAGPGAQVSAPFTGRANLFAEPHGLAVISRAGVDAINAVHESITIATLTPFERVEPRQMVATVKIIPFAVDRARLDAVLTIAREHAPLLRVAAFTPRRPGLVSTVLPVLKETLIAKGEEAVAARAAALASPLVAVRRSAHETVALAGEIQALAAQGCDPVLVFGASAITDRRDVIPQAIERAGGTVEHFGMPVDPGNLILLGRLDDISVVGLPGCARSPKLNGFDWVLERLFAGLQVTAGDIMAMGVGGLLKEIETRPTPRAGAGPEAAQRAPRAPAIAGVLLAAGQSRRMGAANKLLAQIDGRPMVRWVAEALAASDAGPLIVVTGHEAEAVHAALTGLDATFVHNPSYADGLSTSLKAGIAAVPAHCHGAVVALGDMPGLSAAHVDKLIAAFAPIEGRAICVPTYLGKRGNPVLWPQSLFREIATVEGDVGAKHLIGAHADLVAEVETGDEAVLTDLDTPTALAAYRARVTKTD